MSLSNYNVNPTVGVSDMEKAKDFYEQKLGLGNGEDTGDGGRDYECGGGTTLHVYPSPSASPSGATLLAWDVDDIESAVDDLTSNGVTFEQYDEPMKTDEKGIVSFQDGKGAFFKDPDGNILALAQSG